MKKKRPAQTIFAFVDMEELTFFVWHTKNPNLKSVYEYHYQRRNSCTKDMFDREPGALPRAKMYVLEEVIGTDEEAFRHCVAWTKYFQEYGFECVNKPGQVAYAAKLRPKTETIYNDIQCRTVYEVLKEENQRFDDYGTHRRPKQAHPETKKITVEVTRKQHERLQNQAEKEGVSLSELMRQRALAGQISAESYDFFNEAADQIAGAEAALFRIKHRIKAEQRYTPDDIFQIERITDFILKISVKALKAFEKTR